MKQILKTEEMKLETKESKIVKMAMNSINSYGQPHLVLECPACKNWEAYILHEIDIDFDERAVGNRLFQEAYPRNAEICDCIKCGRRHNFTTKAVLQALIDNEHLKISDPLFPDEVENGSQ